ncbi:MAG: hypothetical protein AAFQ21_05575 [Pseudomonadota bacterium]
MTKARKTLKDLIGNTSGAEAVEYAMILGLMAVALLSALKAPEAQAEDAPELQIETTISA